MKPGKLYGLLALALKAGAIGHSDTVVFKVFAQNCTPCGVHEEYVRVLKSVNNVV